VAAQLVIPQEGLSSVSKEVSRQFYNWDGTKQDAISTLLEAADIIKLLFHAHINNLSILLVIYRIK
jgi:hypothetical protein